MIFKLVSCLVRCGAVRCGVVWCGVMWCGALWCRLEWSGGMVRFAVCGCVVVVRSSSVWAVVRSISLFGLVAPSSPSFYISCFCFSRSHRLLFDVIFFFFQFPLCLLLFIFATFTFVSCPCVSLFITVNCVIVHCVLFSSFPSVELCFSSRVSLGLMWHHHPPLGWCCSLPPSFGVVVPSLLFRLSGGAFFPLPCGSGGAFSILLFLCGGAFLPPPC